MKKWATQVDTQRRVWKDQARSSASTTASKPSDTQFAYMRGQVLENPYQEDDDDEGDDDVDTVASGYPRDSYGIRNGSNPSLRSRSTTGESGPPIDADRVPPPRFPMASSGQAPLTLRTQQLQGAGQESYFSPTAETPMQTPMSTYSNSRTSSSSAGTFPFPRQAPPNGYAGEENNRYTAPAQSRAHMSRDGSAQYAPNRSQRPSLPPNAMSAQGRMRAASSPDINLNAGQARRAPSGPQPPVPDVPPFPTHYAYNAAIVNRSQSSSPASGPPPRVGTQSPAIQRDRLVQQRTAEHLANAEYQGGPPRREPSFAPPVSRTMTPASSFERSQGTLTPASMESRNMSPPLAQESAIPTQLKVKVHCPSAGSTMVLVVSTNISFQSLKDRIDAKLQRSTSVSLGSGQVKLKYLDSDSTYVSIQCDDDVQEAFENWKEQQRDPNQGGLGEIELFCQR